jgi:hypothetical protein
VAIFFFEKKKQKALFRFAEGYGLPNLGEANPAGRGLASAKLYVKY